MLTVNTYERLRWELRYIHFPVQPSFLRRLKELIGDLGGELLQEDSPIANGFRYGGKVYNDPPLPNRPRLTLSAAWKEKGRSVDVRDLAEVFGDAEERIECDVPRNLRGGINAFFRAHKIPYKAAVRGWILTIKDGLPAAGRSAKRRQEKSEK
jgi:hypothetical protein